MYMCITKLFCHTGPLMETSLRAEQALPCVEAVFSVVFFSNQESQLKPTEYFMPCGSW